MLRWSRFVLIYILVLLLTSCCPYMQTVQWSVAGQNPDPTNTPEVSAVSSPFAPTDSVILPHNPPDTCPVTRPPKTLFTPPPPYSRNAPSGFWYGTDSLWTAIPWDAVWSSLPHNPAGFTQKVFWWRKGYSWKNEPQPQLVVTGRRLDAPAPPLKVSRATNAFAEDIQSAMLVGVDFPTLGCWQITGRYAGTELSFVVWIAP